MKWNNLIVGLMMIREEDLSPTQNQEILSHLKAIYKIVGEDNTIVPKELN